MNVAECEASLQYNPDMLLLVDVREEDEIHIYPLFEDDTHMPIIIFPLSELVTKNSKEEIQEYLDQACAIKGIDNKDRLLVMVCRSGGRSQQAERMLEGYGFDVENLEGGYSAFTGIIY